MRLPSELILDTRIRYNQTPYQVGKRIFDILASAIFIVLLSPVLILIALAIAAQDGFPVVFRQRRIGLNGQPFFIYKFRTMVRNAEEILRARPELLEEYRRTYKIANDPRISKLGAFLRKTSLDELPQLFNVLKGDMSLVGPRPVVEPEIAKYGENAEVYLAMKPGCAGLWQCSGRSDTTYEERVQLDRQYYYGTSLRQDFGILCRTFVAVLYRRGAQ